MIVESLFSQITNAAKVENRYIFGAILSSTEPNLANLTFAALIQAASDGDRDAQTEICLRYEPKVRIVARVLLGPALRTHFDSLDLVQSVHRSLLVGLRHQRFDISSPEKLIALANTIVRRKIARKWRRALTFERIERQISASDSLEQTLCSISHVANDPAKEAEYRDQVSKICEHLNADERRMLEMRLAGYTSGEVAAELGIHMVALRVRWHRLRSRLESAGITTEWM